MGRLEVITGPMFSGKSEELIKRLTRAQIGGKAMRVFKPLLDDRGGKIDTINSHAGSHFECEALNSLRDMRRVDQELDIIGVDEAQFFDKAELFYTVALWREWYTVIVAGLNLDFRREPFGAMVDLMNAADTLTKLNSICSVCKSDDGIYTQRLIDGEPAPNYSPLILVGGTEAYEARCYHCYQE